MIPGADGLKTGYTRASGFNLRHLGHKRRQIRGRRGDGRGLCRHFFACARMDAVMSLYVKGAGV